jgi:hypothetical protein
MDRIPLTFIDHIIIKPDHPDRRTTHTIKKQIMVYLVPITAKNSGARLLCPNFITKV